MDINKQNTFELDSSLKEILDNLSKIVNNNYGLTYYEKNYKNKHRNGNRGNHKPNINFNNNQWRLKKTIIKKKIDSELDKYKYEINSLLNKLSKNNFDSISKKIIGYYKKDDLTKDDLNNLLNSFIDSIFLKATMQPIYCPFYVKFLNILDTDYKILSLINQKCENYKEIFENSNRTKEMSEYDQFCQDNLDKVFKAGYSQFIGELFNNNMIQKEIIEDNIDFFTTSLEKNIENSEFFENIIICVSNLITTTSENLTDYNFKELYDNINSIYKSYNKSKRLKFKLLDLCEYIQKLF
tara:strand:- start:1646 stop:2533 length:888 start_codon:yes stop_codon:yes gene_type:complete